MYTCCTAYSELGGGGFHLQCFYMQPQKTSFHYQFSSQADITELHACFQLQLMPQRKQMEWYRSEQINCRLQPPTRTDQGCDWPHTNTLDCRTRRHTPHTTYHATTTQSKMPLWTDLHITSLYQVEGRGEKNNCWIYIFTGIIFPAQYITVKSHNPSQCTQITRVSFLLLLSLKAFVPLSSVTTHS